MVRLSNNPAVLLVTPSVGFARRDGRLWFDKKFVEGMRMNRSLWGGPIRAGMRAVDAGALPFGDYFEPEELPFDLIDISAKKELTRAILEGVDVVLAGDMYNQYGLTELRENGTPAVCFVLEHDLQNRLRMAWRSKSPFPQRLKTMLWTLNMERRRMRAMRQADAIQTNGTNAHDRYARVQPNALLFFDARMKESIFATPKDMERKSERLRSGAPLRLAFTGRLESIKGADHLPLVAKELIGCGVDFRLDVFGAGALEQNLRTAIAELDLTERMFLNGAVDFETALVPHLRNNVDIFICCHRQSDPSCTYLETYSCGVPIVGYSNAAFEGIRRSSLAGWSTPMDNPARLAEEVARLDCSREELIEHACAALAFSREHTFEKTFERRIGHLKTLLK